MTGRTPDATAATAGRLAHSLMAGRGISTRAAARAIGVPTATLARKLTGRTLNVQDLYDLAQFLSVPVPSLLPESRHDGALTLRQTARALTDGGTVIGVQRLTSWLLEHHWCRRADDGLPRAAPDRIASGQLRHEAQRRYSPTAGRWVTDPPLVLVTPQGLTDLTDRLAPHAPEAAR